MSNNAVGRWIGELSKNILSQVVSKTQNPKLNFFATQFEEATNVAQLV